MSDENFVSLETLAGGAAVERVTDELKTVLENILDPNTDAKAIRSITLQVKIKPDIDRQVASATVCVRSTLAPAKGVDTRLYIGKSLGVPVAMEHNPKQPNLDFDSKGDLSKVKEVSPNAQ